MHIIMTKGRPGKRWSHLKIDLLKGTCTKVYNTVKFPKRNAKPVLEMFENVFSFRLFSSLLQLSRAYYVGMCLFIKFYISIGLLHLRDERFEGGLRRSCLIMKIHGCCVYASGDD